MNGWQPPIDIAAEADSRVPTPRAGQALFARAFVPGALVVVAAAWLFREAIQRRAAASSLGIGAMTLGLLLWIVVIWCAEQLYPARPDWNYRLLSSGALGWRRFARDMFYLVYVTQGTALLIGLADARLTSALGPRQLALWPTHAPLLARVALAFLLVELGSYWLHRAAHRFRVLWQFHSTHHVITELGGLKSIRTHPVENVLFYLVRSAPCMLLGAGPEELVAATYLGSVLGILAHANIRVGEGPLGWVVNLPQYHRVHHSADLTESNSNFGCHTVLWDRVFRTFRRLPEAPAEIGVRPLGRRSLWQELVWPFYRSVRADEDELPR